MGNRVTVKTLAIAGTGGFLSGVLGFVVANFKVVGTTPLGVGLVAAAAAILGVLFHHYGNGSGP